MGWGIERKSPSHHAAEMLTRRVGFKKKKKKKGQPDHFQGSFGKLWGKTDTQKGSRLSIEGEKGLS